jgi:Cu-processing system ATP-binding protein
LDPVALLRLKDLITEEIKGGKTILFTTHIMSLVEDLAEEIIFILEGKVYFHGTQSELISLTGEKNLERSIAKILDKNGMQIKTPADITSQNDKNF